jgi:lysophospholipase L1-like esterase
MRSYFLAALLSAPVAAHDEDLPVNPLLGVPGFPDCVRAHPDEEFDVAEAANDLVCHQNSASQDTIRIGMVGDSITAGVCSSGGDHPYPKQLQILLDQAYGEGVYSVTNLGACGSTMLKGGNSPYWERGQYKTLTSNKWDIITIMLGTNDAKDAESHAPSGQDNWHHDCSDEKGAHTAGCQFAADYKDMIDVVRTLGTTDGVEPKVYAMIPPPLMQEFKFGMNRTVINTVYPDLVPLISSENKLTGTIDVFSGMGGVKDWESKFPDSCQKDSPWKPCGWWCDDQHCDQCHPNDNGYAHLATVVQAGLGLTGPTVTV